MHCVNDLNQLAGLIFQELLLSSNSTTKLKIKTQKSKPTINFNEFYYINSNHNTAAIRVKATQVFPTFSNYIIFGLDSLKLKGP